MKNQERAEDYKAEHHTCTDLNEPSLVGDIKRLANGDQQNRIIERTSPGIAKVGNARVVALFDRANSPLDGTHVGEGRIHRRHINRRPCAHPTEKGYVATKGNDRRYVEEKW